MRRNSRQIILAAVAAVIGVSAICAVTPIQHVLADNTYPMGFPGGSGGGGGVTQVHAGSGISVTGTTANPIINSTSSGGSVTNVSTTSTPSWLTATWTNPTTTPAVTIASQTGLSSHQVLGTFTGTTLSLGSLLAADLPATAVNATTNLSPLFTSTIASQSLNFTLSTAAAHTWFGNNTGSTATPGYQSIGTPDLPSSVATSIGGLSPLFTAGIAAQAISFTLSNAAAHTVFMNNTGSTAAPGFESIGTGDLPTSTTFGPQSLSAHQWFNSLSSLGVLTGSQPAFTDISGSVAAGQMPALTGDVTSSAGSVATTLATVNSNVGSFTNANITVNAKGLITAAANGTAGGGNLLSVSSALTANTTAVINTLYPCNTSGGGFALTLPDATVSANKGGVIVAYLATAGNNLTINTTSSQLVNGLASGTVVASTANTAYMFVGNGTGWNMYPVVPVSSATSHQWVQYFDAQGVAHLSQPAFTDVSGTLIASQEPATTVNSTGNLSPLFTSSIATQGLSFTQSNAAANTIFGNNTASSAAPVFFGPSVNETVLSNSTSGVLGFNVPEWSPNINTTTLRKWSMSISNGLTSIASYGVSPGFTVSGTPTASNATANGFGISVASPAATSGSVAGYGGATVFMYQWKPLAFFKFGTDSTATNVRYWVGLTSNLGTLEGTDTPSSIQVAALRYSTGAGDTDYMFVTSDGTSTNVIDTGVAFSTSAAPVVAFDLRSASQITVSINGVIKATSTAHLPASTTPLAPIVTNTTTANATSNIIFYGHQFSEN